MADKIFQRKDEIIAAATLADLFKVPSARCHPLHLNREGEYAVDLVHPKRLVFRPAGNPAAYQTADGQLDRSKVTEVTLWEVIDYH